MSKGKFTLRQAEAVYGFFVGRTYLVCAKSGRRLHKIGESRQLHDEDSRHAFELLHGLQRDAIECMDIVAPTREPKHDDDVLLSDGTRFVQGKFVNR